MQRQFGNSLTNTNHHQTTTHRSKPSTYTTIDTQHHPNNDAESQLLLEVYEAKSEQKKLQSMVSKWERALNIDSTAVPLVHRLSTLLDIVTTASTTSSSFNSQQNQQEQQSHSHIQSPQWQTVDEINDMFSQATTHYVPPKMSLTTFASCTPRQFDGTQIGEATTLVARPSWVPDDSATECVACNKPFGLFSNRRHHCRACGGLYDSSCCDNKVRILKLKYDTPVLVCKFCLPTVVQSNESLTSRSTKGPYYKEGHGKMVQGHHGRKSQLHMNRNGMRGGETKTSDEKYRKEERKLHFEKVPSQEMNPGNEYRINKRKKALKEEELLRKKEREVQKKKEFNLKIIQEERNAFVERRKRNGNRITQLRGVSENRNENCYRGDNGRNPSPLSDCGSISDLQFV